jgi:hypothetical protein
MKRSYSLIHHLYGSGVYSYFRDADCRLESGIEVPNTSGVRVYHACSVFLSGYGEITHAVEYPFDAGADLE